MFGFIKYVVIPVGMFTLGVTLERIGFIDKAKKKVKGLVK